MADYRRSYVPHGSFFFTVVTERRAAILSDDLWRDLLRATVLACRQRWPFHLGTLVMLRDDLYTIWALPPGETDYSTRWGAIKNIAPNPGWRWVGRNNRELHPFMLPSARDVATVIWEHTLRDERDCGRHCDDFHYNPVKHGLVDCPHDCPDSTFHRWWNRAFMTGNGVAGALSRSIFSIWRKLSVNEPL